MPLSMSPRSILPALTLLFTILVRFALARSPNVGFQVSINTYSIDIFPSSQRSNLVRASLVEYTFIVPLTVIRRSSSSDDLQLTLFTRPYDYDEDLAPQEVQVYAQPVFMNEYNSYDVTATFNLTTNSTVDAVHYLRAQVDIQGGESTFQTITGASVLSYNSTSSSWTPYEPATYAHQENEARHAEYEDEMSRASVVPIDTSADTVIRGQLPDLPVEDGGVVVIVNNPPVEPGNMTGPPDGKPPPPSCVPVKQWKRNNSGGPWMTSSTGLPPCPETTPPPAPTCVPAKQWKRNNDGKPWNSSSLPPCPETTPPPAQPVPPCNCTLPPPPCPSGLKHAPIHARQATGPITTLQLTLNYGPSATPVPIRQLQVTAFAIVNDEVVPALGTTDNAGFVSFQFPVAAGTDLLLYRLSVSMDAEKYRISTSPDLAQTFLFWRLNSIPLTFEFDGGSTASFTYRFMNKATNDILNVQDRTQNSWVFAKTHVANFDSKLPYSKLQNVWFPGNTTDEYFSNDDRAFINIHPDHATYTSAQAHEYGHWFHYQARKAKPIDYSLNGPEHNFCQAGTPNSPGVSLTEGFATAFGLSSLWQSRFQEVAPTGTGTAFVFFDRATDTGALQFIEIEQYNCTTIPEDARDLSTDEGRIAAALRDLIDANADDNESDTGLGRGGLVDTTNILRRKVLYDPMVNNPSSMQQYWNNFKAVPGLTAADIDAAWNVFQFQYAKFPRDQEDSDSKGGR